MPVMAKRDLGERVTAAAQRALDNQKYVSAVDVLNWMGMLSPYYLEKWGRGEVPHLEGIIQCGPAKLSNALRIFRNWAEARGLKPAEAVYSATARGGKSVTLQFSASGDPAIEAVWRTHYVSPDLPEKKQQRLVAKASAPKELVVFSTLRDSKCSECGQELLKVSTAHAVVVRFSRSRGRYERQGLLVEPAALARAEDECLADEELRLRRRERDVERRDQEDAKLVERMTAQILALYPRCPPKEAHAIAAHTAARGSGRVGRTGAGRALEQDALRMAVIAAVRHGHTGYDELLMQGVDRREAREQVRPRIEAVLDEWSTA